MPSMDSTWCYRAVSAMPLSRQCLKGFIKSRPSVPYPPLTWDVTCVIAVWLAKNGFVREGIAMLLCFDCLLRSGELVRLVREDVVATGDPRVGSDYRGTFLRLARTKTGNEQSVDVLDTDVQQLLLSLVACTAPRQRLFPFSSAHLLAALHKACSVLGLAPGIVIHSGRHGGATRLWMTLRWSVESIMLRGRWKSADSARRYIQSGRARLAASSVPDSVAGVARVVVRDLIGALRAALSQD